MKPRILLSVFAILLVQLSFGQDITKADVVKFKIKSITTIDDSGKVKFIEFYDDKGNLIKQGSPKEDQTLQADKDLFYNDSLQLTEERTYTTGGDVNSISKYYYDSKSELVKKESLSYDRVDAVWTYEYDVNGNKVSETQTSGTMGNSLTKYKYDANNLLIQEDKTNNSIGKEERVNYKYSDNKQIIEKKTRSYYFNTTITLTYQYNDNGKLTKLI